MHDPSTNTDQNRYTTLLELGSSGGLVTVCILQAPRGLLLHSCLEIIINARETYYARRRRREIPIFNLASPWIRVSGNLDISHRRFLKAYINSTTSPEPQTRKTIIIFKSCTFHEITCILITLTLRTYSRVICSVRCKLPSSRVEIIFNNYRLKKLITELTLLLI